MFRIKSVFFLWSTWFACYSSAANPSRIVSFPSKVSTLPQFTGAYESAIAGLEGDASGLNLYLTAFEAGLVQIQPTSTPTSIPQALAALQALVPGSGTGESIVELAAGFLFNGLSARNLPQYGAGYTIYNNQYNKNTRDPSSPVYPSASTSDPLYSLSEATLRRAIYIPSTFSYGKNGRQPLLMVPGTATPGGVNWIGNYYGLLKNSSLVDPVWLNVPVETQIDIQDTAEYVAYAAHYLRGISNNSNVTIVTWSQGSIDTQWALKYWPSLRSFVPDVVAFSPDYRGTAFSSAQCLDFPHLPCPPGARQQRPDSNFLAHLHANNGISALVPTTTVYSIFDEIVQPQEDPIASGFIEDAFGIGASNNQLQTVCNGRPGGGFYTHEGVLYNALGYALFMDAITHDGPANLSRINVTEACSYLVTPGLGLADVLATEGIIPVAALAILNATNASPESFVEPTIKPYARDG